MRAMQAMEDQSTKIMAAQLKQAAEKWYAVAGSDAASQSVHEEQQGANPEAFCAASPTSIAKQSDDVEQVDKLRHAELDALGRVLPVSFASQSGNTMQRYRVRTAKLEPVASTLVAKAKKGDYTRKV